MMAQWITNGQPLGFAADTYCAEKERGVVLRGCDAGSGKVRMKGFLKRINYRIRDRLLWASMPMFFLSLMAIGICSYVLFNGYLTHTRIQQNGHELTHFRQAVWDQAAIEALSMAMDPNDFSSGEDEETTGLVRAVISDGSPDQTESVVSILPASRERKLGKDLAVWWQDHRPRFETGKYEPGRESGELVVQGRKQVRIFSPFLIQSDGEFESLLPVLVQDGHSARQTVTVCFLDLQQLLDGNRPSCWWCALSPEGIVLAGSDPELVVGRPLTELTSGAGPALLAGTKGENLLQELADKSRWEEGNSGSVSAGLRVGEWLLSSDQRDQTLSLLTAVPTQNLKALIGRYTAMSLGIGLLALILTMLGILRVVEAASARIYALGGAMRAVARGDLDRRLEVTAGDEVATLFAYFNDMADDLSENRRLAEHRASQLRSSVADLQRLDRAKQEFLTLVSHEVRTPLTAIKGGIEYLRSSLQDTPEQEMKVFEAHNLPDILEIIEKNTRRLGGFMNDATVMANVQSLRKRLTINSAPVGEIIANILDDHTEQIEALELDVTNELAQVSRWALLGDIEMLSIALEKVIDNAVTHNIPQGRILIQEIPSIPGFGDPENLHRKVETTAGELFQNSIWDQRSVHWRLIEIRNTGAPIPANRREALFTKFELVGPIENHQRGTGLSMPIVKTVLQRHGGGIFVGSTQEGDNSFYLLVPTSDQVAAQRMPTNLWDDARQGPGGIPWDENVHPGS